MESILGIDQPKKIRIVLVDDHPLMRRALRDVLEREPDFAVVGEAGNGSEGFDLSGELRPDIVIMDISMPVMDGGEANRRISAFNFTILVLILTVPTDAETLFCILQAWASGHLG